MLERLQVDLEVSETDEVLYGKLSDKVNDAYGFVYALSQFVSPNVGSALQLGVGMRATFDFVTLMDLVYALFIFVFNCGIFFAAENRRFLDKLTTY